MCGIAGWMAEPGRRVARDVLSAMSAAVAHRGPDGAGEYHTDDGEVGLAHRRLSIIDLSEASRQPMIDEASGLVLVYNGELYNFRELRTRLEQAGHSFASAGDTEVVLRAFLEWGPGCFERFAGMFAIALWHPASRRLWLARDATGIKPLYFLSRAGLGTLFASEVKAFLAVPGFRREVDRRALGQFLELGYVFEDRRTIFQGVEKVLPGEVLELREGRVRHRSRHFRPPLAIPRDPRSPADRVEELHATLAQVVREHLVADVPVGLLLSGGIDSSLVAALASRDANLSTVTLGFAESQVDERAAARRVADALGTRHLEVLVQPREIEEEVRSSAWVFDDLFGDWGTISTRLLYRKFRDLGFKVALVGEGADELFGGYPVFERAGAGSGPGSIFRLYQRYSGRRHGEYFREFRSVFSGLLDESREDLFQAIRRFEAERQLPNHFVMKVDKAAMSVSLEARTPFLDRRVAELAYRTPADVLLRDGENKWLLREAARRHRLLPLETTRRRKFGAPVAISWLEEIAGFREFAREVVLDPAGWVGELGLRAAMERYFAGRPGYPAPHPLSLLNHLAWRLLLLNLWSSHYSARALGPDPAPAWIAASGIASGPAERSEGLVSVVLPVHNRPKLLSEAVESVLAQTHRPIELLIVDDGSTDSTPATIEQLSRTHPEIVRGIRRSQGGPGLARESGRRAARGEFLQYLDSDDLLLPDKLERQVAALRAAPDAIAAYGIAEEVDSRGEVSQAPERPSDVEIERMFPTFLRLRWWHTSTPLYRAALVDEAGPWSDLWLEEDWEYDSRVAALGRPVRFVPVLVARHRDVDPNRLSRGAALDPVRLRQRARSHELILAHARRAGIGREVPEMERFARELFLLSRQCAAAALAREAARLFALARSASGAARARGADFRVFSLAATTLGWPAAGRIATAVDRLRAARRGA